MSMKTFDRTMSMSIYNFVSMSRSNGFVSMSRSNGMNRLYNYTASECLFGYSIEEFNGFLNRLKALIEEERCIDAYKGLRIAELVFKYPYLGCVDYHVIALAVM